MTFLDRETVKIDVLIAEQQRLIDLLKKKRQAVISHAVTKGSNPEAPIKDSGIEWLGEVPLHWKVAPFLFAIRFQEGPGILAVDFRNGGIPLLRVSCVQNRWASIEGCNYLDPEKVLKRWEHFQHFAPTHLSQMKVICPRIRTRTDYKIHLKATQYF